MTFDELREFVESIEVPALRTGIFRVKINNRGKHYDFHQLKRSEGYNSDCLGFSLNHYGWLGLPMPEAKRSRFHDSEDVCVDFSREEFVSAERVGRRLFIKMNTFRAEVSW